MDREIPGREIVSQGGEYLKAFVEAAQKECDSWREWGPVRPLNKEEALRVLRDPALKGRVLKARVCYRNKNAGRATGLRAKARIVVLGHKDPDLEVISREAPTPHRLSEMAMITVFVSGLNQRFGRRGEWFLMAADASTAFLQGRQPQGERPDKLYMSPPQDPIVGQTVGFDAHAPRLWSQAVIKKLTAAGFKAHSLDRMLFSFRDSDNELLCLVLVYVDDFLMCYHETYDISVLKEMFKWGEWTDVRKGIKFKGKELVLVQQSNGELCVKITQTEFIKNSSVGKITRDRSQGDPLLTPAEMTEFRSCSGCLQWLAGQTRPNLAAGVSLANKGTETTVEDLKGLYRLMSFAKATDDVGLVIRPIPLDDQTVVVSYGDSSWAKTP